MWGEVEIALKKLTKKNNHALKIEKMRTHYVRKECSEGSDESKENVNNQKI